MDEKRRAELGNIVRHFRGKPVNNNVLAEYCKRNKFQPLLAGEYSDYLYQVEHDDKVSALFPLILAEIQKIAYIPEFASESARKKLREQNDEVRVNITKLFEEYGIEYRLVDTLSQELGAMVGQTIVSAGTTAFNKALEVLLHVAKTKFGAPFNMRHAADYAKEVFDTHHNKGIDKPKK